MRQKEIASGKVVATKLSATLRITLSATLLATATSAWSAPAEPTAADTKIPVEAFAKRTRVWGPTISPDGKLVAFQALLRRNNKKVVGLTVSSHPDLTPLGNIDMGGRAVPYRLYWVNDNRFMVRLGWQPSERDDPIPTSELLHLEIKSRDGKPLFERESASNQAKYLWGRIENVPETKPDHVFVSRVFGNSGTTLYDVDLANRSERRMVEVPPTGADFYVQHNSTPRFAVATNKANKVEVYRLNDSPGSVVKMTDAQSGKQYLPLGFSADDQYVFAAHSKSGEPPMLIKENLASGERRVLFQGGDADFGLQWDSRGTEPLVASSGLGIPRYIYLSPDSEEAVLHRTLVQQFEGNVITFVTRSRDGSKLIFVASNDRDPGHYYFYDKQSKVIKPLYAVLPQIDPEKMADRVPFEFNARDGMKIHGFVTLPLNAAKQKPPVVVVAHSGLIGSYDTWNFDTDAQFLASRGYAVVQVNFRGSGGRGETFKEAGYGELGGKILDDILDGLTAASKQFSLDDQRACTFGGGYGGHAAMMLPVRAPGVFKCAISYAGVYDLPEQQKTWGAIWVEQYRNKLLRDLGSDTEALKAISPVNLADKIKVPVMLVHDGQEAPPAQFKRMKKALEKAGNRPETVFEDEENRGPYDEEHLKNLYLRMEDFLGRHLRSTSGPKPTVAENTTTK